jgi:hypothetical protein
MRRKVPSADEPGRDVRAGKKVKGVFRLAALLGCHDRHAFYR